MPLRLFDRNHGSSSYKNQVEPESIGLKKLLQKKDVTAHETMLKATDRTESESTLSSPLIHASLWYTHQSQQSNASDMTAIVEHDLASSLDQVHLQRPLQKCASKANLPLKKSPTFPPPPAPPSSMSSLSPSSSSSSSSTSSSSLFFRFLSSNPLKLNERGVQKKKKAAFTPEQLKKAKAIEEREHRVKEVMSVLERRRKLPRGLEHLVFKNLLGDGSYGFVLTAFLGAKEVAVKFIFKEKVPRTAWIRESNGQSIPSEIFFLKRLNHPNIISYLGYYEDNDYFMLVTELHGASWDSDNPMLKGLPLEGLKMQSRAQRVGSDGKGDLNTLSSLNTKQRQRLRPRVSCDLFECIDAHDFFPERVVRHIFRQIAAAVNYLHQNGIVHRDLKDENVVIDERYNVKLIDFGSAAYIPPATGPLFDKFLGTMDFAAPEIIEGCRYRGVEVEVWALGVLLYILVFRQVPFKTPKDIVDKIMYLPTELNSVYAGATDFYDLLNKILHKNPAQRPTVFQILLHPWLANDSDVF